MPLGCFEDGVVGWRWHRAVFAGLKGLWLVVMGFLEEGVGTL